VAETRGDHAVKGDLVVEGNAVFEKGLKSPYLEVIDQKAKGSAGGTFTGSSPGQFTWQTRDLTNVLFNDFATSIYSGSVDIDAGGTAVPGDSAGQITLEAGQYYTEISAPALNVNEHVARLADVTDDPGAAGSTVILGTSEFSADTFLWRDSSFYPMQIASSGQTRSHVTGQFSLTAQRTLEVQHQCSNTQTTDGFGSDGAFYQTNNVFTIVKMWQVREE
jgi:hypothetical protein